MGCGPPLSTGGEGTSRGCAGKGMGVERGARGWAGGEGELLEELQALGKLPARAWRAGGTGAGHTSPEKGRLVLRM